MVDRGRYGHGGDLLPPAALCGGEVFVVDDVSRGSVQRFADRWRAQAVVWPKLARATMRAVNSIPPQTPIDPVPILVDQILEPIARNEWAPRAPGLRLPNIPPDKRLGST